jgi:hypothetical protein
MAEFIRKAKSGSDWTQNELAAYNITVVFQDAVTFFGTPNLSPPDINPTDFLNALDPDDTVDDNAYQLLRTMDLAMAPAPEEESAVDDFAMLLLRALDYARRGRVLRSRKDIPLLICGENRHAKTDVCLIDEDGILLLVQEDKSHLES